MEEDQIEKIEGQDQNLELGKVDEIHSEKRTDRKQNRLMDMITALVRKMKGVFRDYPVTLLSVIIAALFAAILVDCPSDDLAKGLIKSCVFFAILAIQCVAVEEIFAGKRALRIVATIGATLIAGLCTYVYTSAADTLFSVNAEAVRENLARFMAAYRVTIVSLSLIHMYKRLEEDFESFCTKAFWKLAKATVIYGLFAIGLAIIIVICNVLINDDMYHLIPRVEIFLAGGIYMPMCLKAVSGKNETPGRFAKVCTLYVLQPMLLVAFTIIYLYFGKIILTNSFPNNEVFAILTFLFAVGMPIWTMVRSILGPQGIRGKVASCIPFLFSPFIFLQAWCISQRISEYGFTVLRYMGLALILFESIYFVLYILQCVGKRKAISYTLYVIAIIAILGLIIPGCNYEDVIIQSQMKRIDKILAMENPTEHEKENAVSALNMIGHVGHKGMQVAMEKKKQNQNSFLNDSKYADHESIELAYVRTEYDENRGIVPVAGYSYVYMIRSEPCMANKMDVSKLAMREYYYGQKDYKGTVDLSELIDELMEESKCDGFNYVSLEGRNCWKVDENSDLFITSFELIYNIYTKTIDSITFEGYILEK